jgi:hypothetical protein
LDTGYWTFDYAHTYPIVAVIYFVPFVSLCLRHGFHGFFSVHPLGFPCITCCQHSGCHDYGSAGVTEEKGE